jgi:hypothetical protein
MGVRDNLVATSVVTATMTGVGDVEVVVAHHERAIDVLRSQI